MFLVFNTLLQQSLQGFLLNLGPKFTIPQEEVKVGKKKSILSQGQTSDRQGFLCPGANVPPICEELDRQAAEETDCQDKWVS